MGNRAEGEKIVSNAVHISSEGGPLLIADAEVMQSWKGVDDSDYERACELFDDNPGIEGGEIGIGSGSAILWEMNGAGTAYVFTSDEGSFTIVRAWLSDPENENAINQIANETIINPVELGLLTLSSKALVVIWSAENGACVMPEDVKYGGRPSGEMAIDDSGYIFIAPYRKYRIWHDEVTNKLGLARRCHIKPIE